MSGYLLLDAFSLINGDRQNDYGDPAANLGRIAIMWSAYLGREISGLDVGCMMALLNLSREANRHKLDNLVDAAGYIALAADAVNKKLECSGNENNS